jgi:DNA-directed RNA polymerase subunit RPC12/RpoP
MKLQRVCKTCESNFEAFKTSQMFCCRECFRQDYYARQKIKKDKDLLIIAKKFPEYNCHGCGKRSPLDFQPKKNIAKYDKYCCPFCGFSVREDWESRNVPGNNNPKTVYIGIYTSSSHSLYTANRTLEVSVSFQVI